LRPASSSIRRARPLLGTFVEIAGAGADRSGLAAAVEAAFDAVATVHRLMSFHEADSDVGRLNREAATRPVRVHSWTYQVLETAAELHRRSGGAFDIAVAPVLQSMGLLPRQPGDRSLPPQAPQTARAAHAIELLPGHAVRFRQHGLRIDLGGIAKGFAVDRAVEVLRRHGLPRGLINAGGDVAAFGPRSATISIRDPRHPDRLLCRAHISNEALASTGARFDPFRSADTCGAAIIDPGTREPVRAIAGATVCAPSCMLADALTKVVMIAGDAAAQELEHYRARALLVGADGAIRVTPGWQQSLAA
jgi:thiamine biosynthesis lipoprotein